MSIIFSRNELSRFERLVSKMGIPKNSNAQVCFTPSLQGVALHVKYDNFDLSYDIPTVPPATAFSVLWENMKELAAKPEGEIRFDLIPEKVVATWTVKGVPLQKQYVRLDRESIVPRLPEKCMPINHRYFDAIVDAGRCADTENTRYALGGAALYGDKSRIAATNGRVLFIQENFTFPWDNTVICQIPKLFASKELRDLGKEVSIGYVDHNVFIESGPMKLWLKEIDGKFPRIDQIVPDTTNFTKITLDPKDAKFVIDRIDSLPSTPKSVAVYLEANDRIGIRGYDTENSSATELQLSYSRTSGSNVKCSMDRTFLKDALLFGCLNLEMDKDAPMVGRREGAVFVWMPLAGDEPQFDRANLKVCASSATMPASSTQPRVPVSPVAVTTPVVATAMLSDVIDVVPMQTASAVDKAFSASIPAPMPSTPPVKARPSQERHRGNKSAPAKPGTLSAILEKAEKTRENMRAALAEQNETVRELRALKSSSKKREKTLKDTLQSFQGV